MTKINNLFFKTCGKSINDYFSVEENISHSESIAWFSKMAREKNLSLIETNDALKKIQKFIDKKKLAKEEIVAELQLSYGFQELLEEKRDELLGLMTLKN